MLSTIRLIVGTRWARFVLAAAGFFLPAAAKPRKQPVSTNPWYP